ncbi:lytic transglycosylase domain-containing protein [Actinomadura sp. 9N407]
MAGSPFAAPPYGQDAGGDTATMGAVRGEELASGHPHRSGRRPGEVGGRAGKRTGMKIAAVAAGAAVVVGGGAATALALTGGDGKATVSSAPADAAQAAPPIDPQVFQQQRREQATDRANRAARQAPEKRPVLLPKGSPIPKKTPKKDEGGGGGTPTEGNPVPAGVAQAYAKSVMDDPGTQFGCLQKLWNKESHWNYKAANPSSGAYGIPQALPGSKMASEGADWKTNYKTQIRWGLGYIDNRYGTPCKAWGHSQDVGWY